MPALPVRIREFRSEIWLPRPIDEVFAFFSSAANLNQITPPWVNFRILTKPPIEMQPGALIDYRIRIRGIPIGWRTRITMWQPPHRFVDEQVRGPYRLWEHTHEFETRDGGTIVRDRVRYAVRLDPILHRWFVRRDVEGIFSHRTEKLRSLFPPRQS